MNNIVFNPHFCLKWMRISIGLVYIWFGTLKFFPGLSPAETLASDTISIMTFGLIEGYLAMIVLAFLEVIIGVSFIFKVYIIQALWLMLAHMFCTISPVILLPEVVFTSFPFGLTLVGQYIAKNFVFIFSAMLLLNIYKSNEKLGTLTKNTQLA